jgi:hypothetical protein
MKPQGTQVFTTTHGEMNTWLFGVNLSAACGCWLRGSQVVISRQDLGNGRVQTKSPR